MKNIVFSGIYDQDKSFGDVFIIIAENEIESTLFINCDSFEYKRTISDFKYSEYILDEETKFIVQDLIMVDFDNVEYTRFAAVINFIKKELEDRKDD